MWLLEIIFNRINTILQLQPILPAMEMKCGEWSHFIKYFCFTDYYRTSQKTEGSNHPGSLHRQSWHYRVVSSSLASDHRPRCSLIDERMIWGVYAICNPPGWLIYLDSLVDRDQWLSVLFGRLHRCNGDTTHFNLFPDWKKIGMFKYQFYERRMQGQAF